MSDELEDYIVLEKDQSTMELIVGLGVVEVSLDSIAGEYVAYNTKTDVEVYRGKELVHALLKSQDEANAWLSACETRRNQDVESSTGILIPDKTIITPPSRGNH